ncbi:MAG: tyrosine-type recombinase/integrase [Myxococcota bacterium]
MTNITALPNGRFRESSSERPAPPRRKPNAELRTREHLTPAEVERLITVAGKLGRHGHRDSTMILVAFRHGLRVSELVSLRWDQVDLEQGLLHVRRRKNGIPSTHPLRGPELRALRQLERKKKTDASYVFVSERKGPMTDSAFRKIVARAGVAAELGMPVHPHMWLNRIELTPDQPFPSAGDSLQIKSRGRGWQTHINDELRKIIHR